MRGEQSSFRLVDLPTADILAHVMVDGQTRATSVLTLSHWASSNAPRRYYRDTSAEMCFAYRSRPHPLLRARAVTCDHLDEDGLVSLAVFVAPHEAFARRERLEALARAGDFAVARDEHVLKMALAAAAVLSGALDPGAEGLQAHFGAALTRLVALVDDVETFAPLYDEELQRVRVAQRALATGAVRVEEDEEASLAIFTIESALDAPAGGTIGHAELPLHPFALHRCSDAARVLVVGDGAYWYYDRYETWVRYVSRPLLKRRDLVPLAADLRGREPGGASWHADPPSALVPVLHADASELAPEFVRAALHAHLLGAPVGWDPFSPAPARAGARLS